MKTTKLWIVALSSEHITKKLCLDKNQVLSFTEGSLSCDVSGLSVKLNIVSKSSTIFPSLRGVVSSMSSSFVVWSDREYQRTSGTQKQGLIPAGPRAGRAPESGLEKR